MYQSAFVAYSHGFPYLQKDEQGNCTWFQLLQPCVTTYFPRRLDELHTPAVLGFTVGK
jgi:hypothetical protein